MKSPVSKDQLLLILALCGVILLFSFSLGLLNATAAEPQKSGSPELMTLQAEVARLKSIATDQSHIMADAGYHFANLWFAGQKKNWPLAKFYFDETRSHLNWAVRVIPIRKDPAGNEIDLKAILQSVDNTLLIRIDHAIQSKDSDQFVTAYKETIEGCYSCHKASGKPFLRPQIPTTPPQPILNYDPAAKWPE
jgi:hypothetical protein